MPQETNVVVFRRRGSPPQQVPPIEEFIAQTMSRDYPDANSELAPNRYIGGHGEDWRQK